MGRHAHLATDLLALSLLVAAPAAAQAGVVSVAGTTLSFAAGDDEANNLTVSFSPGLYTLVDSGATLTAGPNCTRRPDVRAVRRPQRC